jgi:hypothetical protein
VTIESDKLCRIWERHSVINDAPIDEMALVEMTVDQMTRCHGSCRNPGLMKCGEKETVG